MSIAENKELLRSQKAKDFFSRMYGEKDLERQIKRYETLLDTYKERFGDHEGVVLFSSPGRTEIGGNHTDHNHGKVLTASITLDCIGACKKTDDNIISVHDITYNDDFKIDINNLEKQSSDNGAMALIRGILKGFINNGYKIGGFNAVFQSNVIRAAGVSSSAAFEMIICMIINTFYNEGKVDKVTFARIGQFAENEYWGKQSGLLDQCACAFGGLITIDFENPKAPKVRELDFDFSKENHSLIIVNTGKNHADLSAEYSSIPIEMKSVAKYLGGEVLRDVDEAQVIKRAQEIAKTTGDRAILRAIHYFEENKRVDEQVKALENGEFGKFLGLVTDSGNSSWKYLQNCYNIAEYNVQGITMTLALTELFLKERNIGACRVHGGGFAGVIMVILPNEYVEEYTKYINEALPANDVYNMSIRSYGVVNVSQHIM